MENACDYVNIALQVVLNCFLIVRYPTAVFYDKRHLCWIILGIPGVYLWYTTEVLYTVGSEFSALKKY